MPDRFAHDERAAPRPGGGPATGAEPAGTPPLGATLTPRDVTPLPREPVTAGGGPGGRVPWVWICLLAPLALVAHSLGAPLGQAVAEDFDFLHRTLFSPLNLLDGGGSAAFWRPLSHQLYYRALAPVILGHPGVVAGAHVALLALSTVLIYRAFRRAWPPAWAATIATFPLLSESTRTLIAWPSHFVDLGVWLFTAVLLHETAARRLWSALLALLAALLCKEVALVAAVLVPWLPGIGPRDRRGRLLWAAAMAALAIAWGSAYWTVRERANLRLPHGLEVSTTTAAAIPQRVGWAAGNSVRAYASLPAVKTPRDVPLGLATAGLVLIALALLPSGARRRGMPSGTGALAAWGLAWFLASSAAMAAVFPMWMPNRSGYGSLGFGALAAAFLGAAHWSMPGLLVALRLFAFALAPRPPVAIDVYAPQTGAFLDFERLVRLQRFVRLTHEELLAAHPTLPRGALVGRHLVPRLAMYGFGEDLALQVWYRDTTLRWLPFGEFLAETTARPVTIVEFQHNAARQIALVDPAAMRALLRGAHRITRHDWPGALRELAAADSLQGRSGAYAFHGIVADRRSLALAATGEGVRAEREALSAVRLWPEAVDARYVLARLWARAGRFDAATSQLDTLLVLSPADSGAARLRRQIRAVAGQVGARGE